MDKKTLSKYNSIKEGAILKLPNTGDYDINFVVTVRERKNFIDPFFEVFELAANKSDLSICLTIVEHSNRPDHSKWCKKNKVNYIYIECEPEDEFDKTMGYEIGALFSVNARYHIFHEVDIHMKSCFFEKISNCISNEINLTNCFPSYGIADCGFEITKGLIRGSVKVEDLDKKTFGVSYNTSIKEGSLFVKDSFLKDNGYESSLRMNSYFIEGMDLFCFWRKDD